MPRQTTYWACVILLMEWVWCDTEMSSLNFEDRINTEHFQREEWTRSNISPLISQSRTKYDGQMLCYKTNWCVPMVSVSEKGSTVIYVESWNNWIKREKESNTFFPLWMMHSKYSHAFSSSPSSCHLGDISATDPDYLSEYRAPQNLFQREMVGLLWHLEGASVFVDDILVYACDKEEHDERLDKVLEKQKT